MDGLSRKLGRAEFQFGKTAVSMASCSGRGIPVVLQFAIQKSLNIAYNSRFQVMDQSEIAVK
jgi:hypothetical protein